MRTKGPGIGGLLARALAVCGLAFGMQMWSVVAQADPIGPDCSPDESCFGNLYLLQAEAVDTDTFNIFLSIDTTGYNGGGDTLDAVAFKIVAQDADIASVLLTAAPGLETDWTTSQTNLNANGCGAGGGGWVCSENTASDGVTVPDGIYQWTWAIDVTDDFIDPASVKALFLLDGQQHGITSENITLQRCVTDCGEFPPGEVPEPGTALLAGLVLLGLGLTLRARG